MVQPKEMQPRVTQGSLSRRGKQWEAWQESTHTADPMKPALSCFYSLPSRLASPKGRASFLSTHLLVSTYCVPSPDPGPALCPGGKPLNPLCLSFFLSTTGTTVILPPSVVMRSKG